MDGAHDSIVWSLNWHPLGHILTSGSNDHTWYASCETSGIDGSFLTVNFGPVTDREIECATNII